MRGFNLTFRWLQTCYMRLLTTPALSQLGFSLRRFSFRAGVDRYLITGSCGQIGVALSRALRGAHGAESLVATDVRRPTGAEASFVDEGPFTYLNVMDKDGLSRLVVEHGITRIIHNASILSAVGEQNPQRGIELNTTAIENVLEVARMYNLRVLAPSSIAAFGPSSPKENTPDITIMRPTTVYGITKVYGELLGDYYHQKYGVDYRSLRYPGIISAAMPGGGTTDWAIHIFYEGTSLHFI